MQPSPDQFRAARALLNLEQGELAARAQVSIVTVRRLEGADGGKRVAAGTQDAVRRTLEQAGAEFIPDGVQRRSPGPVDTRKYEDLRDISLRSARRLRGHEHLRDSDLYDENGLPM